MMRKLIFGAVFFFGILLYTHHADASVYIMRDFTLDTQGKTLLLNDSAPNRDAKLIEYSGTTKLKDWKVKYEQKGHSRAICEPPVLNFSFDKFNSEGVPKELFKGVSTYGTTTVLQYQKIRLIPECDIWNEYWLGGGDTGFSGKLNVSLREFIIQKIFRKFGISTSDVLGLANIKFISTDPLFNGKTFRYVIIQRAGEQDDQIPFTKQFNLSAPIYESEGTNGWTSVDASFDRLRSAVVKNSKTGETVNISFDRDSTLKFLLLTEFLNLGDMGPLHNEEWGVDKTTGKTKIIPHGFDSSFGCFLSEPSDANPQYLINNLPSADRTPFKNAYYQIAREIFLDPSSLSSMLTLVDEFSYPGVDKEMLKEYLRIRFYQFAVYFKSQAFAESMGKAYQATTVSLPFASDQEYETHRAAFDRACPRKPVALTGVSVVVASSSLTNTKATFTVDIKTGNDALQVFKSRYAGIFSLSLKGGNETWVQTSYVSLYGTEEYSGPYFIIPPQTTARFVVTGEVYENALIKGDYYMELGAFQPNNDILPYSINHKTNSLKLGILDPIVVTSPKSGSVVNSGTSIPITWSGTANRPYGISLISSSGQYWPITNPNEWNTYPANVYDWVVGRVYDYKGGGNWIEKTVSPGQYRIQVQDSQSGIMGQTDFFTLNDSISGNLVASTTALVLNNQTGLFEQDIVIKNNSSIHYPAVRAVVDSIASTSDAKLWNSMGTDKNGKQFIQSNSSLAPGASISVRATYYTTGKTKPLVDYAVLPVFALVEPEIASSSVAITLAQQVYVAAGGYTVVGWKAKPSKGYAVKYSDDKGISWQTAYGLGSSASVKTTTATHITGSSVQWVDYGPGSTKTDPTLARMYKVFELSVGTYPVPTPTDSYVYQNIPATAKIVGNPTMSLQYDSSNNESELVSTFVVDIVAGNKDQLISKYSAFATQARTSDGTRRGGSQEYTTSVDLQQKNNDFYIIPAGKTVRFTVKTSYNPKQMFAGTYFDVLEQVVLGDYTRQQVIQITTENKTPSVLIVGEKSPYITLFTPSALKAGDTLKLLGQRLGNGVIYIDGVERDPVNVVRAVNGTSVTFPMPPIAAGQHSLNLKDPKTGDSNQISFEVIGDVVVPPVVVSPNAPQTISVMAPVSGTNYNPTYPLKVSWSQNFASQAISIKLFGNIEYDLGTYPAKKGDNSISRNIAGLNLPNGSYTLEVCDDGIDASGQVSGKSLCGQVRAFTIETLAGQPTFASLVLVKSGEGKGVLNAEGTNCTSTCTLSVPNDKPLTITATPSNPTSIFAGWSGGCSGMDRQCSLKANGTTTVTALFDPAFNVSVQKKGTGTGVVTGGDMNCGTMCTARAALNGSVTLTATPDAGSVFTGWSGLCTGTDTCTITSSEAKIRGVTATFDAGPSAWQWGWVANIWEALFGNGK